MLQSRFHAQLVLNATPAQSVSWTLDWMAAATGKCSLLVLCHTFLSIISVTSRLQNVPTRG